MYKFNSIFIPSSYTKLNSEFSIVKIRIAYAGKNRNKTIISEKLLQEMADNSLKNVPIIGYYKEDINNFRGHSQKIEITDDEIKIIDLTRPYGVVPSDAVPYWESVTEANGEIHKYLCVDGVLWSGRYPEVEAILEKGSNQSMEITCTESQKTEDGYTEFTKCEFSALCILGKDDDPKINVEPCFESASITAYSLDKYKMEFTEMLEELKKFSAQTPKEECGMNKDRIAQIIAEYGLVADDIKFEITDDMTEETFKSKLDEIKKDPENIVIVNEKFQLESVRRNALHNVVEALNKNYSDGEDEYCVYYYMMDYDDSCVYLSKDEYSKDSYKESNVRRNYMIDENGKALLSTDETEIFRSWLTAEEMTALDAMKTNYSKVISDNETIVAEKDKLTSDFNALNENYNQLLEFKNNYDNEVHKTEIDSVLAEFDFIADTEDFISLKTKAYEMKTEDVENQCLIIAGKFATTKFSKAPKKNDKPKMVLDDHSSNNGSNSEPYGDLFVKFNKK